MDEINPIEFYSFSVPIHSVNIPDDEVHFREPRHVPATIDNHIAMTVSTWRNLGRPERLHVKVEPALPLTPIPIPDDE